ncbi:MAG: phage major capsid protein [Bermanella sp.]
MKKKNKRKFSAKELVRDLAGQPLYRSYTVDSVDEEARTVELSFSSEILVPRYFGFEVLDHDTSSVRMDRFENGASALVNHDWDDLVGVVEDARIIERKGRALVRFGTSERAEEIWQDVKTGIRKHISIGYMVHAMVLDSEVDDVRTYRVTDWEPFELSFVTVPADPSVGVGRSLDVSKAYESKLREMGILPDLTDDNNERSVKKMSEKILRDASGRLVRAKCDENGAIVTVLEVLEEAGAERTAGAQGAETRVQAILALQEQYAARGVDAAPFLKDPAKTADDYQRALLDAKPAAVVASGARSAGTPVAADSPDIGLTDSEIRGYSFTNVLRYLSKPDNQKFREAVAFELEASDAVATKMGREAQGIIVPSDVLRSGLGGQTRAVTAVSGSNLIGTDHQSGSFIDMLYSMSAVMPHATNMGGLVGDVDIPTQEGGSTGYWLGEDVDATLSGMTFGGRQLTPHTCAALVEVTRKMLQQSSTDMEMLIRKDIARAVALTIDKAALYGAGADDPLGLANITGVKGVNFTADNPTNLETIAMESEIAADNADIGSMLYMMDAKGRGHYKSTQKFAGSNGAPIWEPGNTVNGYGTHVSNQITNKDYWFGVWSEMIIGMWGGLDLTIDPYTHSAKGRLRVVAFQDVDIAVRHPASFCLGKKPVV